MRTLSKVAVACRMGCGRCDGRGHPPWGHPMGQFS